MRIAVCLCILNMHEETENSLPLENIFRQTNLFDLFMKWWLISRFFVKTHDCINKVRELQKFIFTVFLAKIS